jgi:hypothetical protein
MKAFLGFFAIPKQLVLAQARILSSCPTQMQTEFFYEETHSS